ncbi:unnamed protein product [Camellia sinensis]
MILLLRRSSSSSNRCLGQGKEVVGSVDTATVVVVHLYGDDVGPDKGEDRETLGGGVVMLVMVVVAMVLGVSVSSPPSTSTSGSGYENQQQEVVVEINVFFVGRQPSWVLCCSPNLWQCLSPR